MRRAVLLLAFAGISTAQVTTDDDGFINRWNAFAVPLTKYAHRRVNIISAKPNGKVDPDLREGLRRFWELYYHEHWNEIE